MYLNLKASSFVSERAFWWMRRALFLSLETHFNVHYRLLSWILVNSPLKITITFYCIGRNAPTTCSLSCKNFTIFRYTKM